MGDDAHGAGLDPLEAFDDAALTRLAYGRADDDNGRMRAQRAARILAARRPAPTPAPPPVPAAETTPDAPHGTPRQECDDEDEFAAEDAASHRRAPRPLLGVAAALILALVGAGIWLTLPREPAAFAVFAEPAAQGGTPTVADGALVARNDEFTERLRSTGEQLLSPARVLASTGLVDGGIVELVAFRAGRDGDPAERREVCVAVWGTLGSPEAQPRRWERDCVPESEFLTSGIDGVLSLTGVEVRYAWPVAPSDAGNAGTPAPPRISVEATGPTTVAELRELEVPALALLSSSTPANAPPLVSSIVAVVHPPTLDPILWGPVELNRGDDGAGNAAILIGYVAPGAVPGAELSVCVVAAELGTARGIVDQRCAPASQFAASGVGSDQSPNAGFGTYSYRWEPSGESRISVLQPPG